ncbi:phage head closure protein [Geomicrobium sp. JCM 19038]|uniref:phage head closure protein n=1 Tax=Geomicrobium sp. JCM 19038 TaxID=1460635 RepID=UPI00045F1786|nr:phage head closure protein [Geomicrobium sp. JCM 19038]GAK08999.1 hypothetical protein JCM19038_2809 [Geomicrobium sp. JCM 19038]
MSRLDPKRMRHPLEFLQKQPDRSFKPYKKVRAEIITLKGRRSFDAALAQMHNLKTFRIRYDEGIHELMRVRHNGFDYEIQFLNNDDELNYSMTIEAKRL